MAGNGTADQQPASHHSEKFGARQRRSTTRAGRLGYVFLEDLAARQLNRGPTCDPRTRVATEARQTGGLAGGWQHLNAKAVSSQLHLAILHQLQGNGGMVMWAINAAVSSAFETIICGI